jgi:hypothetical protein
LPSLFTYILYPPTHVSTYTLHQSGRLSTFRHLSHIRTSVPEFPHVLPYRARKQADRPCTGPNKQYYSLLNQTKLRGLSPRVNYTDRATAACQRSLCQLLRVEGIAWSERQIPTAVLSVSSNSITIYFLIINKDCCTYLLLHAQQDALTHNKDISLYYLQGFKQTEIHKFLN